MKIPKNSVLLFLSLSATAHARQINHNIPRPFLVRHEQQEIKPIFAAQILKIRGGDEETATVPSSTQTDDVAQNEEEQEDGEGEDLEVRVHAAMKKLGLSFGGQDDDKNSDIGGEECKDGVCTIPTETSNKPKEDVKTMTTRIAKDMNIDESIVYAAIGATLKPGDGDEESRLNEDAARVMIQNEVDAIQRVMEDCEEVKELVAEGHDKTLSRRALAFADMNIEIARAILSADEEDGKVEEAAFYAAEEERQALEEAEKKRQEKLKPTELKTVTVNSNFDPTKPGNMGAATPVVPKSTPKQPPQGAPTPAKKENVVFQATSSNFQKVVLESPVPVLLDVYADWCGPCKALTPALEEMAVKAGGMFRLVKLNTDKERNISSALEVTSLPTVFAMKDGKIVNSFKGMPRSDTFMQDFMMGLFGAAEFKPTVTAEEKKKNDELSNKLIKIAGAAGFSFSQRERLQVRTNAKLDELVKVRGDMADAEESAKVLRSLLTNVISDPFDMKFRRVNLQNKVISARVGVFAPAITILKSAGFANDEGNPQNALILGKGKKIVNVAPLVVARDAIDKWIDMNRRAIATAARKKKDEIARLKLLEEAEEVEEDEYDDEDEEEAEIDLNVCALKVRVEGKNKIHDISLQADDPLRTIIESLPVKLPDDEEYQFTCAARRLSVKSSNSEAMEQSLRHHRLAPAASIVIGVVKKKEESENTSSIKERAAARKKKTKGEHTMQSIGIYAKDDNLKAELIDGGGGVWYEHDISSDGEAENADDEEKIQDESTESTE